MQTIDCHSKGWCEFFNFQRQQRFWRKSSGGPLVIRLLSVFSVMAPRVQVRDVSEMKVQDGSAAEDLSLVNFWTLTGETTSDKLMRLMQKRSDIRDSEIILSFEPMVAYKYVVVDRISDGDRKGIVLRSSFDVIWKVHQVGC